MQDISLMKPPVDICDFSVHGDSVRGVILGPGDVVMDHLPLVQDDVTGGPPLVFLRRGIGEDAAADLRVCICILVFCSYPHSFLIYL